jgi:hypothetical protein
MGAKKAAWLGSDGGNGDAFDHPRPCGIPTTVPVFRSLHIVATTTGDATPAKVEIQ